MSASDTTTAALRVGSTPDSTASLTGALPATAKASATATTGAAPPDFRDGACRRTHCTGVSASAPGTGLAPAHRLGRDDDARGLPRDDQPVDLAHHRFELGRPTAPELVAEAHEGLARGEPTARVAPEASVPLP